MHITSSIKLAIAMGLLGTAGCFSVATVHTAHPVPVGKTEIGINAGTYGIRAGGEGLTVPDFELQLRRGLNDRVDVGARLYPIGAAVDVNFMVAEGLSLDPTFSGLYFSTSEADSGSGTFFVGFLTVPVLYDLVHSDAFTLTVGGKGGLVLASASGSSTADGATASVTETGTRFTYGGSIGAKLRVSEGFALMPALDLLTIAGANAGVLFQFNLGFLF